MSLAFIIGVAVFGVIAYVMWSNRQNSFSKTHLGKSTEYAGHQRRREGHEDTEEEPEEQS
jgi:hypothetical protein